MILAAIIVGALSGAGIIWHGLWRARRDRQTELAAGKAPPSLDWAALDAQRAESVERAERQAELDRDFEEFDRQLNADHYRELHPLPPAPAPYVVKPQRLGERVLSNRPGAIIHVTQNQRNIWAQYLSQGLGGMNAAQQQGLQQSQLSEDEQRRIYEGLQNQQGILDDSSGNQH